jgi:hypothetical protein
MPAAKDSGKEKKQFVCSSCGAAQLRWSGKCPECGEWNTLEEVVVRAPDKSRSLVALPTAGGKPVPLSALAADDMPRLPLRIAELNRVLGGGIVPGSCVLVGGDPASARARCSCRWRPTSRRARGRCSTSPPKRAPTRSGAAPRAWASRPNAC